MHLKNREARKRLTYVPQCNLNQLHKYFKDAREKENRSIFMIPHHFNQARATVEKFKLEEDTEETKKLTAEEKELRKKARIKQKELEKEIESIIIDQRSDTDKHLMRLCKNTTTFDKGNWNERPQLVL